MPIMFYDGAILFVDGSIAMSEACCCDEGGGVPSSCPGGLPDTYRLFGTALDRAGPTNCAAEIDFDLEVTQVNPCDWRGSQVIEGFEYFFTLVLNTTTLPYSWTVAFVGVRDTYAHKLTGDTPVGEYDGVACGEGGSTGAEITECTVEDVAP